MCDLTNDNAIYLIKSTLANQTRSLKSASLIGFRMITVSIVIDFISYHRHTLQHNTMCGAAACLYSKCVIRIDQLIDWLSNWPAD